MSFLIRFGLLGTLGGGAVLGFQTLTAPAQIPPRATTSDTSAAAAGSRTWTAPPADPDRAGATTGASNRGTTNVNPIMLGPATAKTPGGGTYTITLPVLQTDRGSGRVRAEASRGELNCAGQPRRGTVVWTTCRGEAPRGALTVRISAAVGSAVVTQTATISVR